MISDVKDGTATLTVDASKEPTALIAKNGTTNVDLAKADSYAGFKAKAANNEAVYFYDEAPNLNKYAMDGEAFKDTKITTTPKLYVSFPKTDVDKNAQIIVVEGFENDSEAIINAETLTKSDYTVDS